MVKKQDDDQKELAQNVHVFNLDNKGHKIGLKGLYKQHNVIDLKNENDNFE
tara:strand:- start:679 stop:831 length:153 start_codon:yes stop_codon:yes gene_type:complete